MMEQKTVESEKVEKVKESFGGLSGGRLRFSFGVADK